MSVETEENHLQISRREFLRLAALGILGGSAVGLGLSRLSLRTQAVERWEDFQTSDEVLSFIKEKYGIEIPNVALPAYSEDIYAGTSEGEKNLVEIRPNSPLNLDESKILAETLGEIPGAGFLVQLIIPFRLKREEAETVGGSYLGYQWPVYLHSGGYSSFPRDRFISKRAAIKLMLPEGVKMSDSLPTIKEAVFTTLVQFSLNLAGVKANTDIEIPWTTYGEGMKQVIAHETGHALLGQVTLYRTNGAEEYFSLQTFSRYNLNTLDIEHPLLRAFAEINGWKLVPYAEFIKQYDHKSAERLEKEFPQQAILQIWDRDPTIWGHLNNRKVRITPYASYGPIQEAFSEYWMASIFYPDLLTSKEREFFGKIHQGLADDPASFIKSIVENKGLR